MFDSGKVNYKSDVELGKRYRDEQTGFEGIATGMMFFQHACERVTLEAYDKVKGEIREYTFDAPRLVEVATGRKATSEKTGGPRPGIMQRGPMSR